MASTNKTTNFELPQWVSTDKPTFEGDLNSAFLTIDNTMESNKTTAESGNANANNALEKIGNLTLLETTVKDNLVNAINEIVSGGTTPSEIGDLQDLTTNAKNNLVSAINEVDAGVNNNTTHMGDISNLNTNTKNNLVDAVNEVSATKAPLIDKIHGHITAITNSNLSYSNGISNLSNINASGTIKYSNTEHALVLMGILQLSGTDVSQLSEIDLKIDSIIKPPKVTSGISSTVIGFVESTDSSQQLMNSGTVSIYYDTSTSSLKAHLHIHGDTTNIQNVYVSFMPILITDLQ